MYTTELTNFKIYDYEGKLDKSDFAKKRMTVLGASAIEGISAYGEQVAEGFYEMNHKIGQSLMAGMYDLIHKTNYREQLHEQWEQESRAEMVKTLGL